MKLSHLAKHVSLLALIAPIFCNATTESCPTVEQLRSGVASEWRVETSNGNLDNLSFMSAHVTHSTFRCEPFVRCYYARADGTLVIAAKDYYQRTLYHVNNNLWMFHCDAHSTNCYYECSTSLELCSWNNQEGCPGTHMFPG